MLVIAQANTRFAPTLPHSINNTRKASAKLLPYAKIYTRIHTHDSTSVMLDQKNRPRQARTAYVFFTTMSICIELVVDS
jgi:hypothetical protein